MSLATVKNWEKLCVELKHLKLDAFGQIIPVCINIQDALWPDKTSEVATRSLQFMLFEVQKDCEGQDESSRWERLRDYIFVNRDYQISSVSLKDLELRHVIFDDILENRVGHPLCILFLILHLSHWLEIPVTLLQARHHYIFKWVRSGRTTYLNLLNEARAMSDEEIVRALNCTFSNLDVWSAPELVQKYLETLAEIFERQADFQRLHNVYNMLLILDEGNTDWLATRSRLRAKLGFNKEAHCDLKRYFSFVDKTAAPIDLVELYDHLGGVAQENPACAGPLDMLH